MNLRAYDSLDRPPNEEVSKRRALLPLAVIAQVGFVADRGLVHNFRC